MRFSATFSVLAAALAVAPLALAMPVDFDSATGVEARELDVEAALFARNGDPPRYHRNDPIHGKKPDYAEKDPNPPPKYRQKDPYKKDRPKHERNGGPSRTGRRDLDSLVARNGDPPRYHRNDPIHGKKPDYAEKDPNPPPKYRQKDPYKKDRPKHERNGGPSRTGRRDLETVDELFEREFDDEIFAREFVDEDLWARELEVDALVARNGDPPRYHRNDPIHGKKPDYAEKDPNPPPKYRQKDPYKKDRPKHERNGGPSRTGRRDLEFVDYLW